MDQKKKETKLPLPSTPTWDDNPLEKTPEAVEKQRELEGDYVNIEEVEKEETARLEEFLRQTVAQEQIDIHKKD